ncbi:MAG: S8/S53 family peptidase [Halobacteriales archaeon]|nr:S8/S53 family peptidase [Halobacteriales archaeon]
MRALLPVVALLLPALVLPLVPASAGPGSAPGIADGPIRFASDASWDVFDADPASGPATLLGSAQPVCLASSDACPSDAVALGFGGDWPAVPGLEGARRVWAPGFTASTSPAEDQHVYLSGHVAVPGKVARATVTAAADDFVEVRVNGATAGSVGDLHDTDLAAESARGATFDIAPLLRAGDNVVTVHAANGYFGECCPSDYAGNPAMVVFAGQVELDPLVTVALIDQGVNPYNADFRDDSPLARQEPCTYLPQYPCGVPALQLSLDEPDWQTAFAKDAAVWAGVQRGQLYWIPGTKIVGAISLGNGGVNCDDPVDAPPVPTVLGVAGLRTGCGAETRIMDDGGHGTMTASRSAGNSHSLCRECRIVEVEGLGAASLRWVADQPWIDVTSNSWLSIIPAPAEWFLSTFDSVGSAFQYAADRMPTYAASGNGAAYIAGFAPTPTYALSTAAPGVILVGGHDNGQVALWSGAPPTVVADAFGGFAAGYRSTTQVQPDPVSCCTSAASPYAAGGGAQLILEARRILGDTGPHFHDGVLARGAATARGPLSDGVLTMDEFKQVAFHSAQPQSMAGPDDGLLSFTGDPTQPAPKGLLLAYGLGENPFCQGCAALPVPWSAIPPTGATFAQAGYGAINPASVALGTAVLRGDAALPARDVEDAQYGLDQQVRQAEFQLCFC